MYNNFASLSQTGASSTFGLNVKFKAYIQAAENGFQI
jgi:hypothetical protein